MSLLVFHTGGPTVCCADNSLEKARGAAVAGWFALEHSYLFGINQAAEPQAA